MCIAVFLWQSHPIYPFLLFLNRDEYHNRPTTPLKWWEGEEILGGRDDLGGGTWLGCTRTGRIAFLTNFRESIKSPLVPASITRGHLPVSFLKSKKSPMEFAEEVAKEGDQYNGFNLIVADIFSKTMVYVSNRFTEDTVSFIDVTPGMHVLTNATLDSPWPKADRLRHSFMEQLDAYGESELPIEELVEKLMRNTVKDEDESLLPGIVSPKWEYQLSSIFIEIDTPSGRYGTRSISALSVLATGEVTFYEKYIEEQIWKNNTVTYQIE